MKLQLVKFFFCYILLLASANVHSQTRQINGIIIDSATQQPIAFVGVKVKETQKGVLTDIDGRFSLSNVSKNSHLIISHVGYLQKQVIVNNDTGFFKITIARKNELLNEVVVSSNVNPAHRIILLMQKNRLKNDPLHLPSYFYNAYTITEGGIGPRFLTMAKTAADSQKEKESKKNKPAKTLKNISKSDSLLLKAQIKATTSLIKNYMFVAESYSERKYLFPRKSKETVLATKVSGFKNPSFAASAGDYNQFGFYSDYISIINQTYINPVISGSIDLYKFTLREVIPHENDTTWVISYVPKKDKNFNGLSGVLYINSVNYAIENVEAAPADAKNMFLTFRLQQKYERINGQWFPKQLNSYIAQKDIAKDSVLFFWDTRTYLSNIDINRSFSRSEFSDVTKELTQNAGKRSEQEWQILRADSLQVKEKETYKAYDSMPEKFKQTLNRFNKYSEVIALQAIPWGKVDIPFRHLISGINSYEKVRLGFGIQTNTFLSNRISLGGYVGYGLGDQTFKYGGNIALTFDKRTHTELRFSFRQDLIEPGTIPFFAENATLYSNNVLRNLFASRFDSLQQFTIQFNTKITPRLQGDIWLLKEQRSPTNYAYGFDMNSNNQFSRSYTNTEAGIGLRYTTRENYIRFGQATVLSTPPKTRILFQLSRGLNNVLGGQLDYSKLALRINHFFDTKLFGRTAIQFEAGKIWGNVPYGYMYNTRGIIIQDRNESGLYVGNAFQTVGVYEFNSTQSASIFIQQNLGSLLLKPKNAKFRPAFLLVQNIGYGSINNQKSHTGFSLQAPEKGIFETGLFIKDIYRIKTQFYYVGFGIGYFQRYGYYTLPEKSKNGALKFGLTLSF